MAVKITTSIIINASPDKVWEVFSNFEQYSEWNPFLTIDGVVSLGNFIRISAGGLKSKVLIFNPIEELLWKGQLVFPGIFDGWHRFQFVENKNGSTTFIQSERFSGILVPFFKQKLQVNT